MKKCTSCKKEVDNNCVEFNCPGCGKSKIARCENCRATSTPYKCPDCGFEGP
jgi:predicted RNA-binding Zn-ribbon protein involved in translation (DUF1610 family)